MSPLHLIVNRIKIDLTASILWPCSQPDQTLPDYITGHLIHVSTDDALHASCSMAVGWSRKRRLSKRAKARPFVVAGKTYWDPPMWSGKSGRHRRPRKCRCILSGHPVSTQGPSNWGPAPILPPSAAPPMLCLRLLTVHESSNSRSVLMTAPTLMQALPGRQNTTNRTISNC